MRMSTARASPWSSMVDSSLAWAQGNGIWVRWVASRLSLATTPSRSTPNDGPDPGGRDMP